MELASWLSGLWVAQVLCCAFLAVLFLQSGLDKVLDWPGNRTYIEGYFARTPLRPFTLPMLLVVTVLEVLSGVLSAAGALALAVGGGTSLGYAGAVVAGLNIVSLFFGQRMAKDYAAAAGMVPYFLATLAAVLLLGGGR